MATKTKQWSTGTGSATIQYGGQGDGEIIITSDPNSVYEARSMQITVETTDGSGIQRTITVNQAAKQRIDISGAVVTASAQTYSGSAKTPTPTVTLNGTTIPSSGYDVAYSNNTNAGTATITVTGKGDYTGTATGTFTINKATPSYTAPSTRNLTYNGGAQYLTTAGSTQHGTIQYSRNGVNWYSTRRTETNAGLYDCYWRLVGDSNHTDISSTYLGTAYIAKATRSISFSSYPSTLNVGDSDSLSASVSAGSGDGTISFSSSKTSVATVSGSTVTGVGSGSCTIYASVSEGQNYTSASTSYTLSVVNLDYVDLGLPSGKLWAKGNICKSGNSYYIGNRSDYGCYFSWANIDGHNANDGYDFGTSNSGPFASTPGASQSGDISSTDASHDAALACLGSPWHLPTIADFTELVNNTDSEWTTLDGVKGRKYMKKSNHNVFIFLPAAGEGYSTSISNVGNLGNYRSSQAYNISYVRYLRFTSSQSIPDNTYYGFYGFPVRAVRS